MKEYKVDINGIEHTLLLSDEDARAHGLSAPAEKKAAQPGNKAHTPKNK